MTLLYRKLRKKANQPDQAFVIMTVDKAVKTGLVTDAFPRKNGGNAVIWPEKWAGCGYPFTRPEQEDRQSYVIHTAA